ncbi:MAG: hypothetical protein ACRDQX_02100 [Pseudonocardiaceae bacterium]
MSATYRLELPWDRPPLTANHRLHRQEEAKRVKMVRETVGWLAKAARIPAGDHCTIGLEWAPVTKGRRDAINLFPTLKACGDGIVDAGVIRDDTPDLVDTPTPVILSPSGTVGRMWLVITVEQAVEVTG